MFTLLTQWDPLQLPLPASAAAMTYFQAQATKIIWTWGSTWRPIFRGRWSLKSQRQPSSLVHADLFNSLSPKSFSSHPYNLLTSNSLLKASDHNGPLCGQHIAGLLCAPKFLSPPLAHPPSYSLPLASVPRDQSRGTAQTNSYGWNPTSC